MVQRVKDLARSAVAQVTAMARVQSLARELPHVAGMAKKQNKTKQALQMNLMHAQVLELLLCIAFFFFFSPPTSFLFKGCIQGIWKFLSQELDLSHSCHNAGPFNPWHQAGD